ncbi:hypothetical protein ACGF4C_37805 [Streptomyces sp. NPDC048197]|uniref:hypothetical protein n=1 Tax=Streptomyces sp. NPDC048197 TaxID=3365511 RepID=UPI003723CB68
MTNPDFYSRDRPDDGDLPEDRPRGGGPEDSPKRGHRLILILFIALVVIVLIGTILIF